MIIGEKEYKLQTVLMEPHLIFHFISKIFLLLKTLICVQKMYSLSLTDKFVCGEKVINVRYEWCHQRQGLDLLFNCSPELISEVTALQWPHKWSFVSVRRPGRCEASSLRVVKTIRVRKEDLEPWIGKRSEIKVLHLIRDPRAVLFSRAAVGWERETLQAARLCRQMLRDLALAQVLPPERNTLVRYEDLAENTEETVERLYARLGLRWTEEMRRAARSHTEASPLEELKAGGTYRSASFSPETWKQKLSVREVLAIEGECREMMQKADYKMINLEIYESKNKMLPEITFPEFICHQFQPFSLFLPLC